MPQFLIHSKPEVKPPKKVNTACCKTPFFLLQTYKKYSMIDPNLERYTYYDPK